MGDCPGLFLPERPPMSIKHYADISELQSWAENLMTSREPDFIIGDNYLRRWWVIPRNKIFNVYLHEINKSDDDRALHDHPWANQSIIIKGAYLEITPNGSFQRHEGDIVQREAESSHRLALQGGAQVISLFITGPIEREWGFHCPNGWRHWKDFVEVNGNTSVAGRGCGEMTDA